MFRLIRRIVIRALLAIVLAVALLAVLTAATPQGRTAVRTLLFIPQVLPAIPIKPQKWFTGDPIYEQITFPIADGEATADLYLPAGSGKHSAVLFFMGVVPPERDESRIVRLADGLARAGVVVMIPWLDSQTLNRLGPQDIDSLVRGFQHLRAMESVDPDRVGMGGICTGASLTTVAAQDERIRDDVKFINFFAGYYDAVDLLKAIGTRSRFYGDEARAWKPDSLTMSLFRSHLIEGLARPEEQGLLVRTFVDGESIFESQVEALSPEGLAVFKLLQGVGPEEVDELIGQLSSETLEFLHLISPSTNIDGLKARVLIMHDRGDSLVPSEESRRLADALAGDADPYHTEFSAFQRGIEVHVDEDGGVGPFGYIKEAFKLFLHIYNVMREIS